MEFRFSQDSERYVRHSEFLQDHEQDTLHKGRVLVAGCGAGSPIAPHLARRGIGTKGELVFADPDIVDLGNLNRQEYTESQIGVNKAVALQQRVSAINSNVQTRAVPEGITPDNIETLVSDVDVIVDMVDIAKPDLMYALHAEARRQGKPLMTGLDVGDATTISYIFDYRDSSAMTLNRFIGLPEEATVDDLKLIPSFALASQFIIGPVEEQYVYDQTEKTLDYYNHFFETHQITLFESLPPESHEPLQKIVSGEIDYIPQSGYAAAQLGYIQSQVVERLLLHKSVRTVPDSIRINAHDMIVPR